MSLLYTPQQSRANSLLWPTAAPQLDPELLARVSASTAPQAPTSAVGRLRAMFDDPEKRAALMGFGQSMLAASGWSDRPVTLGQAVASGMQGVQQAQADFQQRIAAQRKAIADQARADLEARKIEAETGKITAEARDMQAPKFREVNLGGERMLVDERNAFGPDGQITGYRFGVTLDPAEQARLEQQRIIADREAADREAALGRQGFSDGASLRKELIGEGKPFAERIDAADSLISTLDAPDANGVFSIAAVTQFNKVLDPRSVVRQEEFDKAAGSGGAFSSFKASVESLANGETLPSQTIAQLRRFAVLYKKLAEQKMIEKESQYSALAQRGGIDPALLNIGNRPAPDQGNPNDPSAW